jgi:hypothetical protein
MSRIRKGVKNFRAVGREREKIEREEVLVPLGFRCEPARVLVRFFPFPVYRDFFARTVPTGEIDKRGKPKVTYEGGDDIIGIQESTGAVVLVQASMTPFCTMVKSRDGHHNTIRWNMHLSHGEPAFPDIAKKGPLIPDTIEARDAAEPERTFHVDEWLRSAELQTRFPMVQYLVSYGHPGTAIRMWWRPGGNNFINGTPPNWMTVPAEFENAVKRKGKEVAATKAKRQENLRKLREQKALTRMQKNSDLIKNEPSIQTTLEETAHG